MRQINLYHDQFKPRRQVPWFALLMLTLVLELALMAGVYWYQQRQLSRLRQQQQRARQLQEQNRQALELLQQKVAAQRPDLSLQQQLKLLQQQLRARQPLRQALQQAMARESSLPDVLEGLASRPFDRLWLTTITVEDGGVHLRLAGLAADAERVPVFVAALNDMAVFRQYHFNQLQVKLRDDGLYSFVLATRLDKGGQ